MARAFWKGNVSFGLVEIPVTLRPAVQDNSLSFTLLDRKDFSPVGFRRYNKITGKDVPWEQVVRGYEYEPDEYVALSDEELKQANVEATQSIEIVAFVKREEIDPMFFDTPYYVEPQRANSKSFGLLHSVLERTDRVGIANVVLRTRQHPAALMVRGSALVLNLLRHADQLRDAPDARTSKNGAAPSPREVSLAMKLVESLHSKWDPKKFRDQYHDDVLALIDRKVQAGETHTIVEASGKSPAKPATGVIDLMDVLKKSLASRGSASKSEPKRAGAHPRGAAKTERQSARHAPARGPRRAGERAATRHTPERRKRA